MSDDRPTRHLTPGDLAARLGVPLTTIYDWNSKDVGPRYMRIGRHVRYRLVDVLEWEQGREKGRSGVAQAAG